MTTRLRCATGHAWESADRTCPVCGLQAAADPSDTATLPPATPPRATSPEATATPVSGAIRARPVGRLERLGFWCRRNPALALVSAAGLLVLLAGTVVSLVFAIDASQQARKKQEALDAYWRPRPNAPAADADPKSGEAVAVVLDGTSGKPLGPPLIHAGAIVAMQLCHDGKTALTVAETQTPAGIRAVLSRWDIAGGQRVAGPWQLPFRSVLRMQLCPDDRTVLLYPAEGAAGVILRWDLVTGQEVGHIEHVAGRDPVQFSADGRLALVQRLFTVDVLRMPQWDQPVHQVRSQSRVTATALAHDGARLVTGFIDGRCVFWDPSTGKQQGELAPAKGYPDLLRFTPDGRRLLVRSSEGTARLWDPATGQPLGPELSVGRAFLEQATLDPLGHRFFIQNDAATTVYTIPPPVTGSVDRLALWAMVLSGLELDPEGRVRVLSADEWQQRRRRLDELGGPPR